MRIVLDSILLPFVYPFLLLLFLSLGAIWAQKFFLQRNKSWKVVGVENGLLGIFGVLVSFTMVISGNFVRERADYIHSEADELSLIFRTSKFYDKALQGKVHDYLRDFLRVQISNKTPTISQCSLLIDSMEVINKKLDNFLVQYAQLSVKAESDVRNLVPLVERARSKYYVLIYSFMERTPIPVLTTLIILSFAMAVMVGFMNAFQESKNYVIPIIFFAVTVFMINGIRDLDNPSGGFIKPHYEDLMDVQRFIERGY